MPTKGLTPAQIEFLRSFDTPTVCNVIELYRLRPQTAGYMDARIACCYPSLPPMIGYAATATFRAAAAPVEGAEYGSLDEQIRRFDELPGPPVVVFQDLDSPSVAATFGEVMCTSYQSFGAAGQQPFAQARAVPFSAMSGGWRTAAFRHILCSQRFVPLSRA